jgi:hypothetical protein
MMEVDLVMVYRATSMYSKLHCERPEKKGRFRNKIPEG